MKMISLWADGGGGDVVGMAIFSSDIHPSNCQILLYKCVLPSASGCDSFTMFTLR